MIIRDPKQRVPLGDYEQNRSRFTSDELARFRGQWVAFSRDGRRIVAADSALDALERKIRAAGENHETVALECFPADDEHSIRTGAELD